MQKPALTLKTTAHTVAGEDPIADLISAMLNEGGDYDPGAHGFDDEAVYAHRRVHEFCLEFQRVSGHAPSPGQVLSRYSDFPFTVDMELPWAIHQAVQDRKSRSMRRLLSKMATALVDHSPDEAYGILVEGLHALPMEVGKPVEASQTAFYYDDEMPTCPVAGTTLQHMTGGIQAGQVWYVGARSGRGKSWELARHAIAAAEHGWDVALFSLEMPAVTVLRRIHTLITGNEPNLDARVSLVDQWFAQPGRGRIEVYDPSMVRGNCATIDRASKPNTLVLIDYIGLMESVSGVKDTHERVADIAKEIQRIALRRNVPVIVASQLNRNAETRKGRPSQTDMAQSDAPLQTADLVYYLLGDDGSVVQELVVIKYRHGPGGGKWYVEFRPERGIFAEINTDRAQALVALESDRRLDR